MDRNTKRKVSIGLLIGGLVMIIGMLVIFCGMKGIKIQIADLNTIVVSLFTLGFGGPWYSSSSLVATNYSGNALLGITFIFIIIANLLAIILLYSIAAKRFLPKTNRAITFIIVVLMLYCSITVCCSRSIALSIFNAEHPAHIIGEAYVQFSGNTIAYIVCGFVSTALFVSSLIVPLFKKKETK